MVDKFILTENEYFENTDNSIINPTDDCVKMDIVTQKHLNFQTGTNIPLSPNHYDNYIGKIYINDNINENEPLHKKQYQSTERNLVSLKKKERSITHQKSFIIVNNKQFHKGENVRFKDGERKAQGRILETNKNGLVYIHESLSRRQRKNTCKIHLIDITMKSWLYRVVFFFRVQGVVEPWVNYSHTERYLA